MTTTLGIPQAYDGSPAQLEANYHSHQFQGFGPDADARCISCDCRPSGAIATWPCGYTVPVTQPTPKWYTVQAEVKAFGRDLVAGGFITDPWDLQEYYERPAAFGMEHAWWEANGRTDDVAAWETGNDGGWQL